MPKMPQQKTDAAALGFCNAGEGSCEGIPKHGGGAMRLMRRPSRAGLVLDELTPTFINSSHQGMILYQGHSFSHANCG
jgi:hypothetical protein